MPTKKDFGDMLGGDVPAPEIRRGVGMRLSTDASAESHDSADANAQSGADSEKVTKRGPGPRGIAVSPDLVDRLKILAIKQKRKLYEVMDEAMTQYLQREED